MRDLCPVHMQPSKPVTLSIWRGVQLLYWNTERNRNTLASLTPPNMGDPRSGAYARFPCLGLNRKPDATDAVSDCSFR